MSISSFSVAWTMSWLVRPSGTALLRVLEKEVVTMATRFDGLVYLS